MFNTFPTERNEVDAPRTRTYESTGTIAYDIGPVIETISSASVPRGIPHFDKPQ